MKVKMVKMGINDKTKINCRMRGIVVTEDDKYLFVEISKAYSPNINNTSLSTTEYNKKYPNPEYVSMDFCFRVDIPEDYFNNKSKEFNKYCMNFYLDNSYTKEGIVKVLQKLNKNIDDIELVDENFIDKYCEENGFFELYDKRLKHDNKIIDILWLDPILNGESHIRYKYTCYAKNGTEYSQNRMDIGNIREFIKKYGEENVKPLIIEYIKEVVDEFENKLVKERYEYLFNELFNNKNNLSQDMEDYTDI